MPYKENWRQKFVNQWFKNYSRDFLELLRRGKTCICCGVSSVTFDHVVPLAGLIKAGNIGFNKLMKQIENHSVQFLCLDCNNSKHEGTICQIHNRYLGLWNYLPNLEDMEA